MRALVLFISMRCHNDCAIAAPSHIPVADLFALIPLFPLGAVIFAIQMASWFLTATATLSPFAQQAARRQSVQALQIGANLSLKPNRSRRTPPQPLRWFKTTTRRRRLLHLRYRPIQFKLPVPLSRYLPLQTACIRREFFRNCLQGEGSEVL